MGGLRLVICPEMRRSRGSRTKDPEGPCLGFLPRMSSVTKMAVAPGVSYCMEQISHMGSQILCLDKDQSCGLKKENRIS